MSSSSDFEAAVPHESPGTDSRSTAPHDMNWREALMTLIASRFALIQAESKDATQEATRRASLLLVASMAAFFAWALFLVAGVSMLSEVTGWCWSHVTAGFAIVHLLIGIILAQSAKSKTHESFPITRAEFQKDREWIENFNNKKSND